MAQTYKFGNGTWATKKGSTLAYSDTNNAFKPLPFSFERNSIGTRVNKEGLIEVVGNDIPRIDYTDSTEGALLLENSSENKVTYSEDFSNAFWLIQNASVTLNNSISPNGTLSATKLIENTSNSTHRILNSAGLTVSGDVSMSIFAKKGERNWIRLTNNNIQGAFFDLENGIIGDVSSGFDAKIQSYGNGWYRCSISQLGVANERIGVYISTDGINTSYQGNGTSGVYIYGASLEQGNLSSYIPTNGSTVQRAAETCNESGNSEVFNDSEGVLFADIAALANDGGNRILSINNGTQSERIIILYTSTNNQIRCLGTANGATQFDISFITSDVTLFSKISFKYKNNNFALWVNGFEIGTDTNGNIPSGLSKLSFNSGTTAAPFYGKTKEIAYYDEILTDEELEYMTSYRSLNEMVTELNLNAL